MKNIRRLPAIGVLCLAFLPARPAAAQLVPLGPETEVAVGNELGLQCPQVIGHADRSFSVVWTQNPQVDQYAIVAQRFDGAGVPQGGRIDVDAGSLQHRLWVETQVANRGALGDIVTWSSYLPSLPDTTVRFNSRLLSAPAPARVFTPPYVHRLFPRIGGGYLGSWAAKNACSFALLDANGHPASPAVRLDGSYPDFFCVQATQAANGSFTVDWYHPNGAPSDRFRRSAPRPSLWGRRAAPRTPTLPASASPRLRTAAPPWPGPAPSTTSKVPSALSGLNFSAPMDGPRAPR